jgi:uncharacterized membrane protein YuzA (DUF378 family)
MADIDNPFEKYGTVEAAVYVGSSGGAFSYGLAKVQGFDLIAEVAGSSPEAAGAAFAVAGATGLAANFGLLELGD